MVGITVKEMSGLHELNGYNIVRIPVTVPEGKRSIGTNFCVNIADLSFELMDDGKINTASWSGHPFMSFKK